MLLLVAELSCKTYSGWSSHCWLLVYHCRPPIHGHMVWGRWSWVAELTGSAVGYFLLASVHASQLGLLRIGPGCGGDTGHHVFITLLLAAHGMMELHALSLSCCCCCCCCMFVLFGSAPSVIAWRALISEICLLWVVVVIKREWEWCTFQARIEKDGPNRPTFREKMHPTKNIFRRLSNVTRAVYSSGDGCLIGIKHSVGKTKQLTGLKACYFLWNWALSEPVLCPLKNNLFI